MEPIILIHSNWSESGFIPLYLFLGGLSAGLFIVAICADFAQARSKSYAMVAKLAVYTAFPAWALGSLFVIIHLSKPLQGLFFPLFFSNYGSWMTYGGWAMGLGGPFILVYGVLWYLGIYPTLRRAVGIIGIPFMIWMAINTAMLLSGANIVPFWPRQYLPVLFVNSGLLGGLAAAGLAFILSARFFPSRAVTKASAGQVILAGSVAVIVFELIEILILFLYLNYLSTTPAVAQLGVVSRINLNAVVLDYVVRGPLSLWFWVGLVGIGIVIPLVLGVVELALRRWEELLAGVKFALLIVGGAVLRFVIVWGGEIKPLLPPLG